MEGNMYSRAAEAAGQSFNKVKSWINILPGPNSSSANKKSIVRSTSSICVNAFRKKTGHDSWDESRRPNSAPGDKLDELGSTHLDKLLKYCRKAFGEVAYETPKVQRRSNSRDVVLQTTMQGQTLGDQLWNHNGSLSDSGFDHSSLHDETSFRARCNSYNSTQFNRTPTNSVNIVDESSTQRPQAFPDKRCNPDEQGIGCVRSNIPPLGKRVSIHSITLRTSSYTEEDNDLYSHNYSVYLERVVIDSFGNSSTNVLNENDSVRRTNISFENPLNEDVRVPKPIPKGSSAGRMKICLQYFGTSKILRIIVLRASGLKAKKGRVYPKLSVQCGDAKKKYRKVTLRKVKAGADVAFNEEVFYENMDEAEIDELTLVVRLYNKPGLFRSSKRLGEMMIPVYKYDLSMDTSIWGKLRQQQVVDYCDDGDIEVISEDRSIHASVAASVKPAALQPKPSCRRVNSLPGKFVWNAVDKGANTDKHWVQRSVSGRKQN